MKLEIFIIDANVLIDFCQTEQAVLAHVCEHLANVHVADHVLAEVKELDEASAVALGIHVFRVEYPLLSRAAEASAHSPLGFQDWICLLLAEQEGWICVTNDKRLRTECESRGVNVLWGLQLLLRLVERHVLSKTEAVRIAEAICATNKRIPGAVLAAFRGKL